MKEFFVKFATSSKAFLKKVFAALKIAAIKIGNVLISVLKWIYKAVKKFFGAIVSGIKKLFAKKPKKETEPQKLSFMLNDDDDFEMVSPKKKKLKPYSIILIIIDICAVICFCTVYGPYYGFRDWFVTTALGTGKHKYLANIFYSDEYIDKVMDVNTLISSGDLSDNSLIEFVDYSGVTVYENIYEEQVLKKDEGNDDYKIFTIQEKGYFGYITVIYHPENLDLYISKARYGELASDIVPKQKALIGVNGGMYYWDDIGVKYPNSNMIQNGKIYYNTGRKQEMIGMSKDGVLMLMTATAKEAVDAGMYWGVYFRPFLIVNGEPTKFSGNGGYGYQPRTAIGQRKDGIVILLTIDGRGSNGSRGATMPELVEIFQKYGCINAANLDGGGSTVLVEGSKIINDPCSYETGERLLLDAILLYPNGE